jgi:hypothetical protein
MMAAEVEEEEEEEENPPGFSTAFSKVRKMTSDHIFLTQSKQMFRYHVQHGRCGFGAFGPSNTHVG